MSLSFFSPCPRGLESMLAEDLRALGAAAAEVVPGGVAFTGDWPLCYRVNLESRLATRVLWLVGEGRYRQEEDIYRLAYGITWAKWFDPDRTIRVHVTGRRSPLKSLEFITLRIKDAVCDHFRTVRGERPSVDTARPDLRIHAFLDAEKVALYLDTSGEALYKRGFKRASVEAPLKENLAAGILRIAGWDGREPFADPMCGSGTFLLEAAQIALGIAPGLGRHFAFERMRAFEAAAWEKIRGDAQKRAQKPRRLPIYGSDLEASQVNASRTNLAAAGLDACVVLERADILVRPAPAAAGVLVSNPPYGVRLGEQQALAAFYPRLGDALKQHWSGWRCHFLSADTALPKLIGLKTGHRTPLYNGALECRVYEYRMVAGGNRRLRPDTGEAGAGA